MKKPHKFDSIFYIASVFAFIEWLIIVCASPVTSAQEPELNPPEFFYTPVEKKVQPGRVPFEEPSSTEWTYHKTADNKHPDGNEQQMLWLMNRARANPTAEGMWLSDTGVPDIAEDIINTGVDLDVMKSEFALIPPKPPAAFDVRLYNAAYEHSLNLIDCNCQTHTGQNELVLASGFEYGTLRGNVFSYAKSAIHCHAALNIDWAGTNTGGDEFGMQPGRGHRVSIMSIDRSLYNVGIAIIPHEGSYPNVGPFVMTGNYASAYTFGYYPPPNHFNRFIVGTVWNDSNCNELYDPGEGIGNVTVQPDQGAYYAKTCDSGGYAIPVTTPGSYQITFSGGSLPGQVIKTVEIGEDSILLDINTAAPAASFHTEGPTLGYIPFQVSFTDTSGGNITARQWDFGDGETGTGQNPTHTYSADGKYSVSLTVTGICGSSFSETKTDYIMVSHKGADVNGDARIDLADAIIALRIAANDYGEMFPLTDEVPDVNGDGKTGIQEAIYILRWIAQ